MYDIQGCIMYIDTLDFFDSISPKNEICSNHFDFITYKFWTDTTITVWGCATRSDKYFGSYGQKTDLFLLN